MRDKALQLFASVYSARETTLARHYNQLKELLDDTGVSLYGNKHWQNSVHVLCAGKSLIVEADATATFKDRE